MTESEELMAEEEFKRVWENARMTSDWVYANNKEDARYFFLKGQEVERAKWQSKDKNKQCPS